MRLQAEGSQDGAPSGFLPTSNLEMRKETASPETLNSLLSYLQPRVEAEKAEARSRAAREAIDFDALSYVRRETTLSRILADLLDPRGRHAQDDRFLRAFLDRLGLTDLAIDWRTTVTREVQTKGGRAIDIVIEGEGWIVGIENKPFAPDSVNQVFDYLKHLRARKKLRHCLVYLSKLGSRPHVRSIEEAECSASLRSRELRLLSYEAVNAWLTDVGAVCEAPHVRWFLDALHSHVRRDLLGRLPTRIEHMFEKALIEEASPEQMRTALELLLAKDALLSRMVDRFNRDLRELMSEDWLEVLPLKVEAKYEMFYAWRADPDFGFSFGHDEDDRDEWFYGIRFRDKLSQGRRQALTLAGQRFAKKRKADSNEYWGFWRWFEGRSEHEPREYSHLGKYTRPWEDMCNGEMARHFAALANELVPAFASDLRKLRKSR
jgi:hypothetical protein